MLFDTDANERISLKYAGVYGLDLFAASTKLVLFGLYRRVYPETDRNVMITSPTSILHFETYQGLDTKSAFVVHP